MVYPSLQPDICLDVFLEMNNQISLNIGIVPETPIRLCITTRFCGKTFFAPKIQGNGPKGGFFKFKEKSLIFTVLFYIKNFHLLCSCTNHIFGKNISLEIKAKIFSVNQIAGFLNEVFLLSELMKQSHFQRVDMANWVSGLSLFHMKITVSVTKSSREDVPCYLHLQIFFLYIHSPPLLEKKTLV